MLEERGAAQARGLVPGEPVLMTRRPVQLPVPAPLAARGWIVVDWHWVRPDYPAVGPWISARHLLVAPLLSAARGGHLMSLASPAARSMSLPAVLEPPAPVPAEPIPGWELARSGLPAALVWHRPAPRD